MVINYKALNQTTKFDGYFLPNKEVLLNSIQEASIFSKFDSRCLQIKMAEESIPLMAFSSPKDIMSGE